MQGEGITMAETWVDAAESPDIGVRAVEYET